MIAEKLTFQTQLNREDYVKVSYHITYRKFAMKFMTGLGIFMMVLGLFLFIVEGTFSWFVMLFAFYLAVGLPLMIKFSARRNYRSNKRISEKIRYDIDREFIELTGDSFTSKLTWDKVYNVTETKEWLLIWQNSQVANVVPKRDLKEDEIQVFKSIVKGQKGIKNELSG
jgi:hypothetical protein